MSVYVVTVCVYVSVPTCYVLSSPLSQAAAPSVWWILIVSMAMCAPSRDVLRGQTLVTRVPVAPGLRPVLEVTSACAPVPRVQWGSHTLDVTRASVHR